MNKMFASAIIMSMLGNNPPYSVNEESSQARCKIIGYEHKGKSPEKLEKRRANRKRLKAKRNAKKGIYANKIKYSMRRKKWID